MIIRLPLEPDARRRFGVGPWRAVITCSNKRFRNRPVWVGPSHYLSKDVALDGAYRMMIWLERQTWMGE